MVKRYQRRKVGDIIESNNFGPYEIVEIDRTNPKTPKVKVKFLNSGNVVQSTAAKAYYGTVQDWTQPSVLGRGIIFPGASVDFEREYYLWLGMMCRCYNENAGESNVRIYKDVEVDERWWTLVNFIEDLPSLPGYQRWRDGQEVHLDKDMLSGNNKIYSKETCQFISASKNVKMIEKKQAIMVKHIETGMVHESIALAAKAHKCSPSKISKHCRGFLKQSEPEFIFVDSYTPPQQMSAHKVINEATGEIFDSIRAAARSEGIHSSSMRSRLKRGKSSWKFVK